jgi:chromate reductase, NAD(P)H dehydrogenase (quinone)
MQVANLVDTIHSMGTFATFTRALKVTELAATLLESIKVNGAVPGVLANAIDWASRPTGRSVLRNKPVAVMGAVLGRTGSANAQAALRGVLSRVGAVVVPDPQVLVPHASRLFDEQVNLRDEDTRQEIRQLVEAVAHWCRRVQPEESGGAALAKGRLY